MHEGDIWTEVLHTTWSASVDPTLHSVALFLINGKRLTTALKQCRIHWLSRAQYPFCFIIVGVLTALLTKAYLISFGAEIAQNQKQNSILNAVCTCSFCCEIWWGWWAGMHWSWPNGSSWYNLWQTCYNGFMSQKQEREIVMSQIEHRPEVIWAWPHIKTCDQNWAGHHFGNKGPHHHSFGFPSS